MKEILCFVSVLCNETNSSFSGNHKMKLTSGQNDSLCIQRQVNKQWGEIIAKGAFATFEHSSKVEIV